MSFAWHPPPPDDLPQEAVPIWDAFWEAPRMNLSVTETDRRLVACYCEAIADLRAVDKRLQEEELILRDATGRPFTNPLLASKAQILGQVAKLGEQVRRLEPHAGFSYDMGHTYERDQDPGLAALEE